MDGMDITNSLHPRPSAPLREEKCDLVFYLSSSGQSHVVVSACWSHTQTSDFRLWMLARGPPINCSLTTICLLTSLPADRAPLAFVGPCANTTTLYSPRTLRHRQCTDGTGKEQRHRNPVRPKEAGLGCNPPQKGHWDKQLWPLISHQKDKL